MYKARRFLGLGVYRVNEIGRWNYSYYDTKREAVAGARDLAERYGSEWVVARINRNERVQRICTVSQLGIR